MFFEKLYNNKGFAGPVDDEEEELIDDGLDEEDEEEEEDQYDDEGNLVIDIEDKPASKKEHDRYYANQRLEDKARKENENLRAEVERLRNQPAAAPTPTYTPDGTPKTDEEWDALAEKDWKKAVDLRSVQNAENIVRRNSAYDVANKALSDAKLTVLKRHPELNDPNSEKSKIYSNILNENQEYLNQAKGPVHAMRDMEEYMEEVMGYKRDEIVKAEKRGAQKEKSRQDRVTVISKTGRQSSGKGKTMTLDKDEVEFCKYNDIDPKEYARTKKKLEKSNPEEGISI